MTVVPGPAGPRIALGADPPAGLRVVERAALETLRAAKEPLPVCWVRTTASAASELLLESLSAQELRPPAETSLHARVRPAIPLLAVVAFGVVSIVRGYGAMHERSEVLPFAVLGLALLDLAVGLAMRKGELGPRTTLRGERALERGRSTFRAAHRGRARRLRPRGPPP